MPSKDLLVDVNDIDQREERTRATSARWVQSDKHERLLTPTLELGARRRTCEPDAVMVMTRGENEGHTSKIGSR
jgi:hypothetical protein